MQVLLQKIAERISGHSYYLRNRFFIERGVGSACAAAGVGFPTRIKDITYFLPMSYIHIPSYGWIARKKHTPKKKTHTHIHIYIYTYIHICSLSLYIYYACTHARTHAQKKQIHRLSRNVLGVCLVCVLFFSMIRNDAKKAHTHTSGFLPPTQSRDHPPKFVMSMFLSFLSQKRTDGRDWVGVVVTAPRGYGPLEIYLPKFTSKNSTQKWDQEIHIALLQVHLADKHEPFRLVLDSFLTPF